MPMGFFLKMKHFDGRCIVSFNKDIEAAKIHAENKMKSPDFGLADASILASARNRNIKVVTGDPHFKNFDDSVML